MNRQEDIEPQHEDDWLCTVEFLPNDDLEGRVFAADIVGYLFGYAQLANARTLALVGVHTDVFTKRQHQTHK
jgi:hypothetical protein